MSFVGAGGADENLDYLLIVQVFIRIPQLA
jgi:hypothetical protein